MKISAKRISIIVLLICAVVLTAGVLFKYQEPQNSPEKSFSALWEGVRQNSITQVESAADLTLLSESIVDQLFGEEMAQEGDMLDKIEGWATRKYASFIRPELVKSLNDQMVRFISVGTIKQGSESDILSRLKGELLGEAGHFAPVSEFVTKGAEATAWMPIIRADVEDKLALQLKFVKVNDTWKLVDVPNLNNVLHQLELIRYAKIKEMNAAIQEQLEQNLRLVNIEKSSGISKWGVGKGVMIKAAFENTSNQDIASFHAFVDFIENDKVLKTVIISDTDVLPVGQIMEKSWPMTVNPLFESDNRIYDISSEELTIAVRLSEVAFADGTKIELVRK